MANDMEQPIDLEPLLKSRLAWDLLPHDQMREWMEKLGLTPPNKDVEAMEHREAHGRANLVRPISRLVDAYVAQISEIQAAYLGEHSEASEEQLEAFTEDAFLLGRASTLAVLVEFLADGILVYGPELVQGIIEIQEEEEEDED